MVMRDGGMPGDPGLEGMYMHAASFGGHLFEMADANKDGRVSLQEAQPGCASAFRPCRPQP